MIMTLISYYSRFTREKKPLNERHIHLTQTVSLIFKLCESVSYVIIRKKFLDIVNDFHFGRTLAAGLVCNSFFQCKALEEYRVLIK